MKKVIIIGTGGHAKVVFDGILKTDDKVIGFMDELSDKHTFMGLFGHNRVYCALHKLSCTSQFYPVFYHNNRVHPKALHPVPLGNC